MLIAKERVMGAVERASAIKPGLDYAARRVLDGLSRTVGQRTADGCVYISVLPPLRESGEWRGILSALTFDDIALSLDQSRP